MDLLRNPEDLHLNTVSLKPSDKTKQNKKHASGVNLGDSVYERGEYKQQCGKSNQPENLCFI